MTLPWGLRWWELLPEAVLTAGLGLFMVLETSAATSAFKSRTALLLMVAAGATWLAGRFVLVRYTRWPALRLAVFTAAALGVLRVVVLPAFDDTTVVETLPVAASPTVSPAASATPTAATPTSTTPASTTPTTAGAGAGATTETTTPASGPAPAAPTTIIPTSPTTGPPPSTAPPEPVALGSSELSGIDHRASGTAVLYRQPDASGLVGLIDIDIQPGPDYDVYVVPGPGREDIDDGVRLDNLRGNKGTQYYPVPAGVDVGVGQWTVLVWCQTFDVPVAGATPV